MSKEGEDESNNILACVSFTCYPLVDVVNLMKSSCSNC